MFMFLLILSDLLINLSFGLTGLPQVEKLCAKQETCETRENCPYIALKYEQIKNEQNKPKQQDLVAELKKGVCNNAERGFCCVKCFTTETNEKNGKINNPCVFPFIHKSVSNSVCKYAPKLDGRWCSTKVDSSGNHVKGEWGFCRPECPQTLPPIPTLPPTLPPSRVSDKEPRSDADSDGRYLPSMDNCGASSDTGFIFGGTDTDPGEFPFNGLLGYRGRCRENRPGCPTCKARCVKYKCGGTLINRRYVLTAAHCHEEQRKNKRISEVVLGEWKVNTDPDCEFGQGDGQCMKFLPKVQKFSIDSADVTVHEDFVQNRDGSVHNDIALIRLPQLVELNQAVQPVCLPWNQEEATSTLGLDNVNAVDIRESGLLRRHPTVVGWGYTEFDPWEEGPQGDFGKGSGNVAKTVQQKLKISLLEPAECKYSPNEDEEICSAGQVGKGACQGDSGSGLYLNSAQMSPPWYQIGIISYGSRYCGAGSPTIFTRVSAYIGWIRANLKP